MPPSWNQIIEWLRLLEGLRLELASPKGVEDFYTLVGSALKAA